MSITYNPVQHGRKRHIEVDQNFIKEKLDSGLVKTTYVPLGSHLADVLTKGLPTKKIQDLTNKLRIL